MSTPDTIPVPTAGVGVGIRAVATIIDGFILLLLSAVLVVISGTNFSGVHLEGLPYFYSVLLGFCYFVYFEGTNGATPGKLFCGLRVVKTDGTPCDMQAAAIRTVCRLVDGLCVYLVGAVLIWSSTRNQRLGDRFADTVVLKVI